MERKQPDANRLDPRPLTPGQTERRRTHAAVSQRAPLWMLGIFAAGTLLSLIAAGGFGGDLALNEVPARSAAELLMLEFAFLGATAFFLLQAAALGGLYWRRHWAKTVALVASGLWALTIVGIPISAVVIYLLVRRFRRVDDWARTPRHQDPPRAAYWLTLAGTLLAYPWALFILWLPYQLHQVSPQLSVAEWGPVVAPVAYLSFPFFAVMAVATIGLRRRRDWGLAMAGIACVLFSLTGIGALAGIPVLLSLWSLSRVNPPVSAPMLAI